jgi:hypothetical protein
MARNTPALALLALSLATQSVYAQTAPASTSQSAANAVDPASIHALKGTPGTRSVARICCGPGSNSMN